MSQKHIKILKWVRKQLVKHNCEGPFICLLVKNYGRRNLEEHHTTTEIRRYIKEALGMYSKTGVMHWLHAQGYNVPLRVNGIFCNVSDYDDLCWDYRIRWVDHMMTIMKDWP